MKKTRSPELSIGEFQTQAIDLAMLVAQMNPEVVKRCFGTGVLPKSKLREFRTLYDGLHRNFRRFRDQSQA